MKTFLTEAGKKQLEERLDYLKTQKRPEIIKKIGIAREFGDLSENAEYDAAKEEQAILESEIMEIETKLRSCEIIKSDKIDTSCVNIGCSVKLHDMQFDEEVEYRIIGSTESDPRNGLISNESPVGKAVLGAKVGDIVSAETPAGISEYKIISISI